MRILAKWTFGGAAAAAYSAAICVLAIAFAADADRVASAQGRLEAEYSATLTGVPIGRGTWVIDISEDQFSATASGATVGLLRFFTGGRGAGAARGAINRGQLLPTNYAATLVSGHRVDGVRLVFAGNTVKEVSVDPPVGPSPDRIPVTDEDRRNVVDPITSTMDFVGVGDVLSPQACSRKVAVFDGRMRFDLRSEFKRMEVVKADKGYAGPVVVCAVYFTPIAGYAPDRIAIRYLAALRDAEAWIAPIAGTRVLVPFRFSLPTPLGTGVVQATQFLTMPKQPRAAANVKTQ